MTQAVELLAPEPLWYKDAILYELHVRAFYDSDGDGIGDFRGLAEKLDYLQDLGVTALWLLPFYPSPLKDDGYDISDYTDVHPSYGTLADFKFFLQEAHRRGLRVITELVLNHTSDQHPWFQRARRARPGSAFRDFYVWSDSPERYKEARIIFKDFEPSNWSWDPVAKAYYWHRFYSHQPDLNFDSPEVRREILQVADFWLGLGVDGLRLDAVPYLYEREGTPCENLPETHAFLKELRRHVDGKFKDRMLLAEANQWPEDARAYFGDGDECHVAFHFPLMPRLFMAIRMENRFPIVDILHQTPAIPESCAWALFLRNHDELTLEMVTDEDRDYMVRVYAQDPQARINLGIRRRLAPLLGNHRRKIELMNGLLFSLPGTPVVYYADEIGMGDNIYLGDRNGVRTPFQWSADRNAGFSRGNPQRLYLPVIIDPEYHYEAVNAEAQQGNPHSLLWQMKRLIAMRKQFKAFGRGTTEFLKPENPKVLAFLRQHQEEKILVVANLSRFVQYAELDLPAFKGMQPVEVLGRTRFPRVGDAPYFIVLGPHAIYWFTLEAPAAVGAAPAERLQLPVLNVEDRWEELVTGEARFALEEALPAALEKARWFGGKSRTIKSAKITETLEVPGSTPGVLAFVQVRFTEGEPETYLLPLACLPSQGPDQSEEPPPGAVAFVRIRKGGEDSHGLLCDALTQKGFAQALLEGISRRRRFKGKAGEAWASPTSALRRILNSSENKLEPAPLAAEQSNTSVVFGDRLILKLFRRLEQGLNPELEIGRFLTEETSFRNFPALAGALEYRAGKGEAATLAVLQEFAPSQGDAWDHARDALARYFEEVLTLPADGKDPALPGASLVELAEQETPPLVQERIGPYLESARLIGQRTAQLHGALSSSEDARFAPEPFTELYQRSIYQAMRSSAALTFELLRRNLAGLPEEARADGRRLLQSEPAAQKIFQSVLGRKITAMRIRCHGDYHLGQVLQTGKDFMILDFEGEPARPLSERRLKRCPLRDVAGMIRSFHYAAHSVLFSLGTGGPTRAEDLNRLEHWARFWERWVSATFLKSYLDLAVVRRFLPKTPEELKVLLRAYLLEKALYELRYELNNRPSWVKIPVRGVLQILESAE